MPAIRGEGRGVAARREPDPVPASDQSKIRRFDLLEVQNPTLGRNLALFPPPRQAVPAEHRPPTDLKKRAGARICRWQTSSVH